MVVTHFLDTLSADLSTTSVLIDVVENLTTFESLDSEESPSKSISSSSASSSYWAYKTD